MSRIIDLLAILGALAILVQISSLEFNLGNSYYIILFFIFLLLLTAGRKVRFNFLMIWLVGAALLSILLNEIPSFFRPYERLIAFILVAGLVGPLVWNQALDKFRCRLFAIVNLLLVIMVVISFFGLVFGLSFVLGRSGFTGLFAHSMLMGPLAGIAMLIAFCWASQADSLKSRWIYFGIAGISFVACVAAGSRAALIAAAGGGVFFYFIKNQGKLTRFSRVLIALVTIGIFSYPFWQSYTERIISKMDYAEQQGDLLVTRSHLWQMRIDEFKSSPIVGIGFAAVDTYISSAFDEKKGRIEPGSSWLAVLSMIGLVGFIPFSLLVLSYLKFAYMTKKDRTNSAFLGGLLFFFMAHMLAEGYVFSAGSGLFFYFWLVMGNIELSKNFFFYRSKI